MNIWSRLKSIVKTAIKITLVFTVVGMVMAGFGYWQWVIEEPGEHIERETILKVIAQ